MRYTIGEFASIIGITPDTLRLYEKQDIVRPSKDSANNYRYFNDLDVRGLLMSRWYRSMRIPLNEAAALVNGAGADEVRRSVGEAKLALEASIEEQQRLLDKIREIQAGLDAAASGQGRCTVKEMPGRYRLKQTVRNRLLTGECVKERAGEWMELLPFAFFCLRLEEWRPGTAGQDQHAFSWGLALTEPDMELLGVKAGPGVEYLPPSRCLCAHVWLDGHAECQADDFLFMLDEMQARGFEIGGDVTGKLLLNASQDGVWGSWLEIAIPLS